MPSGHCGCRSCRTTSIPRCSTWARSPAIAGPRRFSFCSSSSASSPCMAWAIGWSRKAAPARQSFLPRACCSRQSSSGPTRNGRRRLRLHRPRAPAGPARRQPVHRRHPRIFRAITIVQYLAFPERAIAIRPDSGFCSNGGLALLARGDLLTEILLYKGVAALAHIGGGGADPRHRPETGRDRRPGTRLRLPLSLESDAALGDGRQRPQRRCDDVLRPRRRLAVRRPASTSSCCPRSPPAHCMKVPVVLIAPILFIGVWRQHRARAIEAVLLSVALAAAVYRPFWEGPHTHRITPHRPVHSVTWQRPAARPRAKPRLTRRLQCCPLGLPGGVRAVALVAFSLSTRAQTYQDTSARLSHAGGRSAAGHDLVPGLVRRVAPGAGRRAAQSTPPSRVALLSLGGLLQYFVFIYLWVIGVFPPSENLGVQGAAYLCIVGPVLLGITLRGMPFRRLRS